MTAPGGLTLCAQYKVNLEEQRKSAIVVELFTYGLSALDVKGADGLCLDIQGKQNTPGFVAIAKRRSRNI